MAAAATAIRLLLNGTSRVAPGLAGRQALFFFRFPFGRASIRPPELPVHQRAETEQLIIDGKKVIVYRWGNGERPVLLLHGWQSRASRFSEFVEALQGLGLTPISFDAPGNGDSGGRTTTLLEYEEIIGRLQARYGVFESVVGHSFGVLSAFYALRNGLQTKSFVALAGPGDFGFLVDGFCAQLGLNSRVKAGLRRRLENDFFGDGIDLWSRFDARGFTADVVLPILLIHDRQDDTVPFTQAELLKAAYGPQLELVETTGLGHHRLLATPSVIQRALAFVTEPEHRRAA
jgi:pimeloyl-ACP methyl ester carboxylesterase